VTRPAMSDEEAMMRAIEVARAVRTRTSPNPWVGALLITADGEVHEGATQPPGGPHAEVVVLRSAGEAARGATVVTTLEPCSHTGRTGPCTEALVEAGVARVVVGLEDPDEKVGGTGVQRLREAGVEVTVGVLAEQVEVQLSPYLKHRRTGMPWVVLKLAATLDGRTAAPDGTSQWITGDEARLDAHRLRAESDAVIVGAGTVRADDPRLTARVPHDEAPLDQPLRVVLGSAPSEAAVHPALELDGPLEDVLRTLGDKGVLMAMVEGGAAVAAAFHHAGLVDRYVVYLAPALFGGDDAKGLFTGPGAGTIADVWRGEIDVVERLGADVRIDLVPATPATPAASATLPADPDRLEGGR
jgi:diaminohydroxyphosphoribosylaminopyrimidine deaminase/5-amino-6-(5-phosphoribosylamino)uracil reductase